MEIPRRRLSGWNSREIGAINMDMSYCLVVRYVSIRRTIVIFALYYGLHQTHIVQDLKIVIT